MHCGAIVASIGAVIMCACDTVYIAENAQTFYHNPMVNVFWETFNAKDAHRMAAELDRASEPIIPFTIMIKFSH